MTINPKYAYAANKALTAIAQWGETITLTDMGQSAFNPATGVFGESEAVEYSVLAIPPVPLNQDRESGQSLIVSEYQTKIAASGNPEPAPGWLLTRSNQDVFHITGVGIMGPAEKPIVYNLTLRKR